MAMTGMQAAPSRPQIQVAATKETEGAQLQQAVEVLLNLAERTLANSRELDVTIFGVSAECGSKDGVVPCRNGVVLQTLDRVWNATHILEVANQQLSDTNQRLH